MDYHLWVGDDINETYDIKVLTKKGSNFFDVMTRAGRINKNFRFEYTTYSIGRFITKIGNNSQDPATNTYWMIYVLPKDFKGTPGDEYLSQVGVDLLIPEENKIYLFWLKTVSF